MRTSHLQYAIMVEFMERHGDLSKPSSGPRGRHFTLMKWKELSLKLNSEGTGDSRTEEKWRKVWSDFKNNTKKKRAKINRAATGTGGGPALQIALTDLELRVLQIIGEQAATGMAVEEAGFQQLQEENCETEITVRGQVQDIDVVEWNMPGTSQHATVSPPVYVDAEAAPSPAVSEHPDEWRPPQKRKKGDESVAHLFVEADRSAREYAREREIVYERFENERLKLESERLRIESERLKQQEYEIRERVRLREQELMLQAQWLEFMREAMKVLLGSLKRG